MACGLTEGEEGAGGASGAGIGGLVVVAEQGWRGWWRLRCGGWRDYWLLWSKDGGAGCSVGMEVLAEQGGGLVALSGVGMKVLVALTLQGAHLPFYFVVISCVWLSPEHHAEKCIPAGKLLPSSTPEVRHAAHSQ